MHTIHVLYIDDDIQNLETVSRSLTRQGYMVTLARTAQEGIDAATETPPDLILLDIIMPDMNGFEVCEVMRSMPRLRKVPIVALTASTMDGDRQMSLAGGFDGYLAKPIARLELFNTIDRFVR